MARHNIADDRYSKRLLAGRINIGECQSLTTVYSLKLLVKNIFYENVTPQFCAGILLVASYRYIKDVTALHLESTDRFECFMGPI